MTEQTAQEPLPATEPAADGNAETNGGGLRCPSCHALVAAGDAFCENCRQPLEPQAATPPSPGPPTRRPRSRSPAPWW